MPKNPRADAALYILTMLLQRVEATQPGVIDELVSGVEADRDATQANNADTPYINSVFEEALATLGQANGHRR